MPGGWPHCLQSRWPSRRRRHCRRQQSFAGVDRPCGPLNALAVEWVYEQIANRIQGGYLRAFLERMQSVPIPATSPAQKSVVESLVLAVISTGDLRLEQLINGLVYELFFRDDLHRAGIRVFDACDEDVARLVTLQGAALQTGAESLAARIFSNTHPIYAMFFDLQTLDVVRIIEERVDPGRWAAGRDTS